MSDNIEEKDMTSESNETSEQTDEKQSGSVLPEPGKVRIGRRNFLGKAVIGCGAVLGLEMGTASFKLIATKPVGERKPVILSLSQLQEGERKIVTYGGSAVEVFNNGKEIKAKSLVCSHLGCLVIWEESKKNYHCPCHDAYFKEDGAVLSGPPTQPLEEIPVTVKGNTVTIGG
jgi:cytochrome b6-f complex iron-sulfur subunit